MAIPNGPFNEALTPTPSAVDARPLPANVETFPEIEYVDFISLLCMTSFYLPW